MNRQYLISSALGMFILTILSLIFYKERTLFIDTAYYVFRMSQEMNFNIELNRWAALIPEIIPLAAMYLKLPLKVVLAGYSLAFWILFCFLFWLMSIRWKAPEAGMAFILGFTLFLRISYFHSVTETHQAVAYVLLLYAWLMYADAGRSVLYAGVAFIICLLGYFSHPVSLFMQVFVMAYAAHNRKLWQHKGLWALLLLLGVLYLSKVLMTKADSYEGSFFSKLKDIPALLPKIHTVYGVNFVFSHFSDIYIWPLLVSLILFIHYLLKKQFLNILMVFGGSFVFLLITLVTYHEGDADVMSEKNYMPYAVFIVLPFARDFLLDTSITFTKVRWAFFSLILCVGLFGIVWEGKQQTRRVDWLRSLTQKTLAQDSQRAIIEKEQLKAPFVGSTWALAHETLLLTALENGPEGISTVFAVDSALSPPTDLSVTDLFMSTEFWLIYNAFTLNPTYFKFKEGRYVLIQDH